MCWSGEEDGVMREGIENFEETYRSHRPGLNLAGLYVRGSRFELLR